MLSRRRNGYGFHIQTTCSSWRAHPTPPATSPRDAESGTPRPAQPGHSTLKWVRTRPDRRRGPADEFTQHALWTSPVQRRNWYAFSPPAQKQVRLRCAFHELSRARLPMKITARVPDAEMGTHRTRSTLVWVYLPPSQHLVFPIQHTCQPSYPQKNSPRFIGELWIKKLSTKKWVRSSR